MRFDKGGKKLVGSLVCTIMFVTMTGTGIVNATAAPAPAELSELPGAVTSQFKRLDNTLNGVVAALEKNQLQTAGSRLAQADKIMSEIQSRHGSRIPEGNAEMKAATERLADVGAQFAKARSAAEATAAAAGETKTMREALSKEWLDKFTPFFTPSGDQELLFGSSFNNASPADQEKCRQAYARANALMDAYGKTEFPHGKTQDLIYMEQRLEKTLADFNAGADRDRQEAACRPWIEKLRPYASVGAGSPKLLIDGVTLSETDIAERTALLKEAQSLWDAYREAEFPLGKSPELLEIEDAMRQRLESMPAALEQSRALLTADIEKVFDDTLTRLTRDDGWKKDSTRQPDLVMERDMNALKEAIARYAGTVPPSDARLAAIRGKFDQICEADRQQRAVRAERTFMKPDRFSGESDDPLRRKIDSIVKEETGATGTLRITLPAENWTEENVDEWTDGTRTARRHRITRHMAAQAAAKGKDGRVYLHGVHLASDRLTDGSWGPLYGHIMGSDWMAEANVTRDGPAR